MKWRGEQVAVTALTPALSLYQGKGQTHRSLLPPAPEASAHPTSPSLSCTAQLWLVLVSLLDMQHMVIHSPAPTISSTDVVALPVCMEQQEQHLGRDEKVDEAEKRELGGREGEGQAVGNWNGGMQVAGGQKGCWGK